ncbi:hypothetical protein [Janthinobacterium agaricidamnosum]|nr:hypothetical protein [Janthinobacterium agaricidamnosum]
MSGVRTPGLLFVAETGQDEGSSPETVIRGMDGQAGVAVAIDFGANNPGMREANAHRLVACWNALDGLSDDHLAGGWNARGMSAYAKGLEEKLRVARDLLLAIKKLDDGGDITDHDEGTPCTSEKFDEVMVSVREVLRGGAT